MSTIRRAMFEPAPDLTLHGVPDGLARLLRESLSKDPERRPATAASFGEAVNELRGALGLAPVPLVLGMAPSPAAGQPSPAGPTREADVSGAFHRVGLDGPDLGQEAPSGGEAGGRRRRKRQSGTSGDGRRRFAPVVATMAVAGVALFASVGLINNDVGIVDDIVDTVSVAPAAADVVPDLGLDDDGPDGRGDGQRGGPDGDGPPDGAGPDGGRPNRGP